MALWKSNPALIDLPTSPYALLREYAGQIKADTASLFEGQVLEVVREDTGEVSYELYLVVPRLRHYRYRLFEATLDNLIQPYPMALRYFAKDPRNNQVVRCQTPDELRRELLRLITAETTQNILGHLQQLVEITESYSDNNAQAA